MNKLLCMIACMALCGSNGFAMPAAPQHANPAKPANSASHRGSGPAAIGGPAKTAGTINGATVRFRH
jgi:hypothetical protein